MGRGMLAIAALSLSIGILTPRAVPVSAAPVAGASTTVSVSVREVIQLRADGSGFRAVTNCPLEAGVTGSAASGPVAQLR